ALSDTSTMMEIYCGLRGFLNGCADFIAPFGPRTIVIADIIEPEQIRKHKPGVAGAFADPAINDRVCAGFYTALIEINFGQLICGFKRGVIICGRFPRHALCARNMTAPQHAFLRILGHVRDLAFVFARRTHIDEWFGTFALGKRLVEERANLLVEAFLRHRIICPWIFWNFSCHWTLFGLPFVATAVENFHFLVSE